MTLKVAFYGTGSRAQPYLNSLQRVPGVELTSVCDLDRHSAGAAAVPWNARVFLSYEAMLDETRPDALWVCVEPQLQSDVIVKAAELKIPFFILPPGAIDFEHASAYAQAIRAANILTAVGYTSRLTDVFLDAREYLGAKPVPLALAWWLSAPSCGSSNDAARLLWNEGCLLIDALRFFCGEVSGLRTRTTHPSGGLVVDLEFQNGATGALACALFARPKPRIELEFLGEGWSLLFRNALATLEHAEHDKTTILHALNDAAWEATTAFLDALADRATACALPSYDEALKTLALCQDIETSAREGRIVECSKLPG